MKREKSMMRNPRYGGLHPLCFPAAATDGAAQLCSQTSCRCRRSKIRFRHLPGAGFYPDQLSCVLDVPYPNNGRGVDYVNRIGRIGLDRLGVFYPWKSRRIFFYTFYLTAAQCVETEHCLPSGENLNFFIDKKSASKSYG